MFFRIGKLCNLTHFGKQNKIILTTAGRQTFYLTSVLRSYLDLTFKLVLVPLLPIHLLFISFSNQTNYPNRGTLLEIIVKYVLTIREKALLSHTL